MFKVSFVIQTKIITLNGVECSCKVSYICNQNGFYIEYRAFGFLKGCICGSSVDENEKNHKQWIVHMP